MHKYYLLVVLIFLSLVACHQNGKKAVHKTTTVKKSNPDTEWPFVGSPVLKAYQQYLGGLDLAEPGNATAAAKKFAALFANEDPKTCDTAYILFDKFDSKLADKIDGLHDKDTTIQYDSLLVDSNARQAPAITGKTALYGGKLSANGLRVVSSEGDSYIVQDMDFEIKRLKSYLSAPMKLYLVEVAKEDKEGLSEDEGLTIGPEQLADRTVWWENFSNKYPDIIASHAAKNNWKNYVEILLTGMDNSPVISFRNFALDDYYQKAYNYMQASYPKSKTNDLISPYFRLVEKKDSIGSKQLLDKYEKQGIIVQSHDDAD